MRDDYSLKGKTVEIKVDLESKVGEQLSSMEEFTGISASELVNTAVKRFISQHKDFFPASNNR